MKVRDVGLDVHLDFCEVAICENGSVRSAGRVEPHPSALSCSRKAWRRTIGSRWR